MAKVRLNKYIASCGYASRRKADDLISHGQVSVDGKKVTQLGTQIDPDHNRVFINGKLLKPKGFVYIKLNKPEGYTCTTKTFANEKNVLDLVEVPEKVYPVGRLDKNSCGLIFLTNDGAFAHQLTQPRHNIEKEYKIFTQQKINPADLEKMRSGVSDEGEFLRLQNYKILAPKHINVILTQGKKRQIRRLFAQFNYEITRLQRIRIDHWQLGSLVPGQWEYFEP